MKGEFQCERLRKAIVQTSYELHKPLQAVVKQAAASFTKTIVSIEPPSNSKTKGSDAKKQGEQAVTKDYKKSFRWFDEKWINDLYYKSGRAFRRNASGHHHGLTDSEERWKAQLLGYGETNRGSAIEKILRDMKVNSIWQPQVRSARNGKSFAEWKSDMRAGKTTLIPAHAEEAVAKKAIKNVGYLAGGWNTAATALAVKVPAWVRRHSTPGSAIILDANGKYTITLTNDCSFIGKVSDHDRRMAWAMDVTAGKLERQMDYVMKHGLKKAGWH